MKRGHLLVICHFTSLLSLFYVAKINLVGWGSLIHEPKRGKPREKERRRKRKELRGEKKKMKKRIRTFFCYFWFVFILIYSYLLVF